MSTDPGGQNGMAPPEVASDTVGDAEASPPASSEQIYEDAMARLAVITDEWQKTRDAPLGG
jgi:hypothetical protein